MADRKPHRGRFQAQGDGTEKSVAWSLNNPCTKSHANKSITDLKDKLSPKELEVRQECIAKAINFVDRSPAYGMMAIIKKSFTPFPPRKDIRIDIEILAGIAFIDN